MGDIATTKWTAMGRVKKEGTIGGKVRMRKVYSSAYIADCDQVKVALSSADIDSMMKNEFGNPIGLGLVGGVAGFTWPELWVNEADYDKAMEIVGTYIAAAKKNGEAESDADGASEWQCLTCGEVVDGTLKACWKCDALRPEI